MTLGRFSAVSACLQLKMPGETQILSCQPIDFPASVLGTDRAKNQGRLQSQCDVSFVYACTCW